MRFLWHATTISRLDPVPSSFDVRFPAFFSWYKIPFPLHLVRNALTSSCGTSRPTFMCYKRPAFFFDTRYLHSSAGTRCLSLFSWYKMPFSLQMVQNALLVAQSDSFLSSFGKRCPSLFSWYKMLFLLRMVQDGLPYSFCTRCLPASDGTRCLSLFCFYKMLFLEWNGLTL
jgi:hypothetical protein